MKSLFSLTSSFCTIGSKISPQLETFVFFSIFLCFAGTHVTPPENFLLPFHLLLASSRTNLTPPVSLYLLIHLLVSSLGTTLTSPVHLCLLFHLLLSYSETNLSRNAINLLLSVLVPFPAHLGLYRCTLASAVLLSKTATSSSCSIC